jgi:ABC-type transport system involved in multi-copper enzyme maturation, permease component
MSFLPLVTLELRAASRRKSTYRIRRWTAVIAFIVSLFFIASGSLGNRGAGENLLSTLSFFAAGLILLAGVSVTPDCISQEKREGTLGLLFLTDLKGYDIVLGKFIARSLNAFYGLLALLPIVAISLILGGLTGAEFWRMALVLINLLFISLTIGIFVSTLVRDSRAATGATLASMILLFAGFPSISWLAQIVNLPKSLTYLKYFSPFYSYLFSSEVLYRSHNASFWYSLLLSNILGWFLLGFSSFLLPRVWQEKAIVAERKGVFSRLRRQGRGSSSQRAKARQKLLPINPVLWLIGDEPVMRHIVWILVISWGAVIVILSCQQPVDSLVTANAGTKILGFFIKLMVASQACRFFVESRRNGALEMLLCTPLRNRDIIRGQWLSLKRIFLWPLITLALLNLVPVVFLAYQAFSGPGISEALHSIPRATLSLGTSCWFTLGLVVDVFTVGWVGMWLGLTAKKPDLAPFWTVLFVLILPSFVCGLDLLVDMFLIIWASSSLQTDLRWTLSRQYQVPAAQMTPQIALPYVPPPPVIAR